MINLFALLLVVVLLGIAVYVLAPLWRRPLVAPDGHDAIGADLLAARTAALQALRELDLDYQLGNLTPDDYAALRERHTREALALLKATHDQAGAAADPLDAAIERAVDELRPRRRAAREGAETGPNGKEAG
jgi:hypothetical protein